jgi:hypothetical protein
MDALESERWRLDHPIGLRKLECAGKPGAFFLVSFSLEIVH